MRAYSVDLRERVVKAADAGMPKSVIARTFSVCRATVSNYLALRNATGDIRPRPIPGRPAYIAGDGRQDLATQIEANPDATLAEHATAWERSHGTRLSISAMHRTIARLDITLKKNAPGGRARPRRP
jgi:transposase